MRPYLPLRALYNYDNTIFSGVRVPNAMLLTVNFGNASAISHVVNTLLLDYGARPVRIWDADYVRAQVAQHCINMLPSWERMFDAITAEYNPLDNTQVTDAETHTTTYGHEVFTTSKQDTGNGGIDTRTITGDDTTAHTIDGKRHDETAITHNNTSDSNGTGINSVTAYDSQTMRDNDSSKTTSHAETREQGADTHTITDKYNNSDTITHNTTEKYQHGMTVNVSANGNETHSGNDTVTITRDRHGNIGVTTNQQMITAELQMRAQLSMVNIIAQSIADEITLAIW